MFVHGVVQARAEHIILYKQVRTPFYESGNGNLGKMTGPFSAIAMFIKECMLYGV